MSQQMLRGTVKIVLGTWKVIVSVSSNQPLKIIETRTSNTIGYFMRKPVFECLNIIPIYEN